MQRSKRRILTSLVFATFVGLASVGATVLFRGSSGTISGLESNGGPPLSAPGRARDHMPTSPTSTRTQLSVAMGARSGLCPIRSEAGKKPLVAVVGASITAGTGATTPTLAWPYVLAAKMGWNVAVRGVPGAGYVHSNRLGGPLIRELQGLPALEMDPSVVILQAGHDDSNEPTAKLASAVAATVRLAEWEAPGAKVVLVTVFPGRANPTPAQIRTNKTIISTALRTDPHAIMLNPMAQHWHYRTIKDHLHPTDAGDRWIASRIQIDLAAHGITSSLRCAAMVIPGPTATTAGAGAGPGATKASVSAA